MQKVVAFQIAEHIELKNLKMAYTGKSLDSDSSELFYGEEEDKFFYIRSYGVVVFLGYDEVKMSELVEFVIPFCKNRLPEKLREEFIINYSEDTDFFGYNEISITRTDPMVFKIIMLNVAQSVAIDYFNRLVEMLLDETQAYTMHLELKGELNISGRKLRRFIGKSLNLKNRIAEHLYIFSSPQETWEDEYLMKIETGMKKVFDIDLRYRSVSEDIQIIKDNLDLFKDLLHHQRSSMLEWIIILLILVEVVNLFIEKLI